MIIQWTSQKGKSRRFNNDAVAFAYIEHYLLAVIVDAAEKDIDRQRLIGVNAQGERLATYWANTCVQAVKAVPEVLASEQALISLLAQQQKTLRYHYPSNIASYGLLVLDTQSGHARWWYSGDCLFGRKNNGDIHWLNTPHRLDQCIPFKDGPFFDSALTPAVRHAAQHRLTQSLNARRFSTPKQVNTLLSLRCSTETNSLLLATDGYWCEHLQNDVDLDAVHDDASLLQITPRGKERQLDTDATNCHEF